MKRELIIFISLFIVLILLNYLPSSPHKLIKLSTFTALTVPSYLNNIPTSASNLGFLVFFIRGVEFIPGYFSTGPNGITCYAPSAIHFSISWNNCYPIFGYKLCLPSYSPSVNYSQVNLVQGWLGFPAGGGPTNSLVPPYIYDAVTIAYSVIQSDPYCTPYYCHYYFNYFNWTPNSVYLYAYSNNPNTYSVINPDFSIESSISNLPDVSNSDTTIIFPEMTCGSFFPAYSLINLFTSTTPPLRQEYGITPALAESTPQNPGGGITYLSFYDVGTTSTYNYQSTGTFSQSIFKHYSSDFSFNLPNLNPSGKLNYLENQPFFFATPTSSNLFNISSLGPNNWIYVYAGVPNNQSSYSSGNYLLSAELPSKNYSFLTYQYQMNSSQISQAISFQNYLLSQLFVYQRGNLGVIYPNISILPIPMLDLAYSPQPFNLLTLSSAFGVLPLAYIFFKTDAIFPICKWDESLNNLYPACTLYNSTSINPIVYAYFFDYGDHQIQNYPFFNKINLGGPLTGSATFAHELSNEGVSLSISSSEVNNLYTLNNVTAIAASSFCFYGEKYNPQNSIPYTAPNYTRYIVPDSAENYLVPVGFCNAFYANTNCFGYGNNINLKEGVISTNVSCTSNGIKATIYDNWITSALVANSEGYACGFLNGSKNISNPSANFISFAQNLTTCPAFNSNSEVNLIITMKNVGNVVENPYVLIAYNLSNQQIQNLSNWFTLSYLNNKSSVINQSNLQLYSLTAWNELLNYPSSLSNITLSLSWSNGEENIFYSPSNSPYSVQPISDIYASSPLLSNYNIYANGPFPNHLLGIYASVGNSIIRSSNIIASYANGEVNKTLYPNQTIVLDVMVPASIFRSLKNIYILGGSLLKIGWVYYQNSLSLSKGNVLNSPAPYYVIHSNPAYNVNVNPLPIAGSINLSEIHNNEIIYPYGQFIAPWQYETSVSINLTSSPFSSISYYNFSSFVINGTPPLSNNVLNGNELNLNINSNISYSLQGSPKSFKVNPSDFITSCFVSPDLLNDFGSLWIKQSYAPADLKYVLSDIGYVTPTGKLYNITINVWKSLFFTPFYAPIVLNYDNVLNRERATLTYTIQTLNTSNTSNNFYIAVANLGNNPYLLLSQINSSISQFNSNVKFYSSYPLTTELAAVSGVANNNLYVYIGLYNNYNTTNLTNASYSPGLHNGAVLNNAILYLTNLSGDAVNCGSAVNNTFNISSYEIGNGEYEIKNGFICPNYESNPVPLIGVIVNKSTNKIIGSLQIIPGPIINSTLNNQVLFVKIPEVSSAVNGFANITYDTYNQYNESGGLPIKEINSSGKTYYVPNNYVTNIPIINGIINLSSVGASLKDGYSYIISFDYQGIPYYAYINISNSGQFFSKQIVNSYADDPSLIQQFSIDVKSNKLPIFVSFPNSVGCNNVRFISSSFEYLPFQTLNSLSGEVCNYAISYNGPTGLVNITIEGSTFSPDYLLNLYSPANITQGNGFVTISYPINATLYENCLPGKGPCLDYNNNYIMFDNVSILNVTDFLVNKGPVLSCIIEDANAFSTKLLPYSVSGIKYSDVFQTETGYSTISLQYCFINQIPDEVLQIISTSGNPIDFSIEDMVNKTFNQIFFNNQSLTSNLPKDLGCYQQSSFTSCIPSILAIHYHYEGLGISESSPPFFSNPSQIEEKVPVQIPNAPQDTNFYCLSPLSISSSPNLYNISPSYTSEFSYDSAQNTLNGTPLAYLPHQYYYLNGGYYYYDCGLINLGASPSTPSYSGALNPQLSLLVNPNGGTLINSCPLNDTILNYSLCTKTLTYSNSNYVANFYNNHNPLCLASLANEQDKLNSLLKVAIGGGCLIGNGFTCDPTYGIFHINLPGFYASGSTNASGSASSSYNSFIYTTTASYPSSNYIHFSVKGSYYEQAQGTCNYEVGYTCCLQYSVNQGCIKYGTCYYPASTTLTATLNGSISQNISLNTYNSPWKYQPNSYVTYEVKTTFNPTPNDTQDLYTYTYGSISYDPNLYTQISKECSINYTGNLSNVNYYSYISLSGSGSWNQSNAVTAINDECTNATVNGYQPILHDTQIGLSWSPYINHYTTNSGGIPMVGICEACRDFFNVTFPQLNFTTEGSSIINTYSCPPGYSGSIYSCEPPSSHITIQNSTNSSVSSFSNSFTRFGFECSFQTSYSCNICNTQPGYIGATPPSCIGYGPSINGSSSFNSAVQYSQANQFGIGLGVSHISSNSSYFIPSQNPLKQDAYMTNLQVGEQEQQNNILQYLPPTSLVQPYQSYALTFANSLSFSFISILERQQPGLEIGFPPIISNEYDFASSLYGSGTSNNCNTSVSPVPNSHYNIYLLGEGAVCSGSTLPPQYSSGIFIPIGELNSGTHTLSLNSISEEEPSSNPIITLYDQYGASSNISCFGTINSSKGNITLSKDMNCDPIESLFRGYIISCITYSKNLPGSIYSFNQSYYMTYNFPTIWELSYTLLVAPKSPTDIPIPLSVKNNHLIVNLSLVS
ncbi:MAG: hypothetical protein QXV66_00465 [Candidatus Rehaiarchaeum fermentans]|nr:hypothetical protein [Candidatus Rehaiarchaeum fermentans]